MLFGDFWLQMNQVYKYGYFAETIETTPGFFQFREPNTPIYIPVYQVPDRNYSLPLRVLSEATTQLSMSLTHTTTDPAPSPPATNMITWKPAALLFRVALAYTITIFLTLIATVTAEKTESLFSILSWYRFGVIYFSRNIGGNRLLHNLTILHF
jgi:hypothetical protein